MVVYLLNQKSILLNNYVGILDNFNAINFARERGHTIGVSVKYVRNINGQMFLYGPKNGDPQWNSRRLAVKRRKLCWWRPPGTNVTFCSVILLIL